MTKPKAEWWEVHQILVAAVDDLQHAYEKVNGGPSTDQIVRFNQYLEFLDLVDDMMESDTKIARFLAL